MIYQLSLQTTKRQELYAITEAVQCAVEESGVIQGSVVVYCPHTTAGITINENADPDVATDLLYGLKRAFPDSKSFQHFEGNSAAHIQASCVGASATLLIEAGRLLLGRWQGIYFCEFDGPRSREYWVRVMGEKE